MAPTSPVAEEHAVDGEPPTTEDNKYNFPLFSLLLFFDKKAIHLIRVYCCTIR